MKQSLAGQIWIEQFMSETYMTKNDHDRNRSRVTSTNQYTTGSCWSQHAHVGAQQAHVPNNAL